MVFNYNPRFLIILDYETNCTEFGKPDPQEITEFPCVVYDVKNDTIDRTKDFRYFIKPVTNIKITDFCTKLTGITQKDVDSGIYFVEALKEHRKWMVSNDFLKNGKLNGCMFVTCGHWDLKTALPNYCKFLNCPVPTYFHNWCNIKILYDKFYGKKSGSMVNMLHDLNIELEGRHHSGIDDCFNIAKIAQRMIKDGCIFKENYFS